MQDPNNVGFYFQPPVGAAARATHRPPPQAEGLDKQMGQMNLGKSHSSDMHFLFCSNEELIVIICDSVGQPGPARRPPAAEGSGGDGNGGATGPVGRGALRGTRRIEPGPVRVTRPATCTSKQGTTSDD